MSKNGMTKYFISTVFDRIRFFTYISSMDFPIVQSIRGSNNLPLIFYRQSSIYFNPVLIIIDALLNFKPWMCYEKALFI